MSVLAGSVIWCNWGLWVRKTFYEIYLLFSKIVKLPLLKKKLI